MEKFEQVRCGATIWIRRENLDIENTPGKWLKWEPMQYGSISLAKKANGLDSRTVESPELLADWQA